MSNANVSQHRNQMPLRQTQKLDKTNVRLTVITDKVGFHKQTSVGYVCRIQFVYMLILICVLFILINNIFVWN